MAADPLRRTRVQIAAANAGDREALNDLLARYLPWVRQTVALTMGRRLRDLDALDDVVQESLLDAFRAIHRFEDRTENGFRHWLTRIVLNNVRDSSRRQAKAEQRRDMSSGLLPLASPVAHDPRPSQIALADELEQRIEQALLDLPALHREIVILRERCGLDDAAIAARLGYKNADTVRALYHRAMKSLRERLADDAPEQDRDGEDSR
jgi:RNA polymerase sigma-70 factor (ECF subfamily)